MMHELTCSPWNIVGTSSNTRWDWRPLIRMLIIIIIIIVFSTGYGAFGLKRHYLYCLQEEMLMEMSQTA